MKEPLIIRKPLSKEDFQKIYDLRWRVLMKPLNKTLESDKDNIDTESYPFIVTLNEKIVAFALFHKISEKEGQIRDLAVEEDYRNERIGSILMRYIEGFAVSLGIKTITLYTTKTIKEFFQKLDYKTIGEGPLLCDETEQITMMKTLN